MTKDEQLAFVQKAFNKPGQKVTGIDESNPPDLVVHVEDEYGRLECTIPWGGLRDAGELERSLEAHASGRASQIGEWKYQKKLSAEIVNFLNGKHTLRLINLRDYSPHSRLTRLSKN